MNRRFAASRLVRSHRRKCNECNEGNTYNDANEKYDRLIRCIARFYGDCGTLRYITTIIKINLIIARLPRETHKTPVHLFACHTRSVTIDETSSAVTIFTEGRAFLWRLSFCKIV